MQIFDFVKASLIDANTDRCLVLFLKSLVIISKTNFYSFCNHALFIRMFLCFNLHCFFHPLVFGKSLDFIHPPIYKELTTNLAPKSNWFKIH